MDQREAEEVDLLIQALEKSPPRKKARQSPDCWTRLGGMVRAIGRELHVKNEDAANEFHADIVNLYQKYTLVLIKDKVGE